MTTPRSAPASAGIQFFWIPRLLRADGSEVSPAVTSATSTAARERIEAALADAFGLPPERARERAATRAIEASMTSSEGRERRLSGREVLRAMEASMKLASERVARLAALRAAEREVGRLADRSARREAALLAELSGTRSTVEDLALAPTAPIRVTPRATTPRRPRRGRGVAFVTGIVLVAAAILILAWPGSAGAPIRLWPNEPVLSGSLADAAIERRIEAEEADARGAPVVFADDQ
ncbi:MAG: hypothetical protein R3B09_34405 [Nannocystaceae bacterium]